MMDDTGVLTISHNWMKSGWRTSHGTPTGTLNNNGTSVLGSSPGFVNEAGQDFKLLSTSAAVNAGTALNAAVLPTDNVIRHYVKHQSGEARPVSGALDIGAYEFSAVAPVQIITSSLPDGRRGRVYSQALTASGGSGNYVWSVSTGNLPAGLRLRPATGRISGKGVVKGTWNFTITAQDAQNASAVATQSFTVNVRFY